VLVGWIVGTAVGVGKGWLVGWIVGWMVGSVVGESVAGAIAAGAICSGAAVKSGWQPINKLRTTPQKTNRLRFWRVKVREFQFPNHISDVYRELEFPI
jgi:hypothetical protein